MEEAKRETRVGGKRREVINFCAERAQMGTHPRHQLMLLRRKKCEATRKRK